jgi:RNA polymerase sigma-70 factor (ECF subfamily)
VSEKEQLFERIVQENRHRVYRVCRAYLSDPDDANDLYQDILLKIWLNLDTFRGEAKQSTWLFRIALNTAIVYRKKQQRQPQTLPENVFQIPENTIEKAEKQQQEILLERLHACIAQLETYDRLIISLVLEEMPYKDIAEVLGITLNHVGVKINRIKQKLANLMEPQGKQKTVITKN